MFKCYSKRLLSPFSGQVQIVELDPLRALTIDGHMWEVQFRLPFDPDIPPGHPRHGKPALQRYTRIAEVHGGRVKRTGQPAYFDPVKLGQQMQQLIDHLADLQLPLPAEDCFEYWLLDEDGGQPLALIYSCTHAEEMSLYPEKQQWTALPAARMKIPKTDEEQLGQMPPVNYRLEGLVNERAGRHPRADWFFRRPTETTQFPPLLVSEAWESEAETRLCQRYLDRQAPLLLMLHGLQHQHRLRLEQAARGNVLEVQRYYPLYPDVADRELMATIRVEAKLRSVEAAHAP